MSDRRWRIAAVLAFCLGLATWAACGGGGGEGADGGTQRVASGSSDPPWTTTGEPHLDIQHVGAAVWAPINNAFHDYAHDRTEEAQHLWAGFLVQAGDCANAGWLYDNISLYDKDGDLLFRTDSSTFAWVNVVSKWEDRADGKYACDTPVSDEEAFWLFPNYRNMDSSSQRILKLDKLVRDSTSIPNDQYLPTNELYRGRQLHPDMIQVRSMVSFWQGDNGFIAKQTLPVFGEDRRTEFWFGSPHTVEVDTLVRGGTAEDLKWASVPLGGEVGKIVIHSRWIPPELGEVQPPPWWWP